MADAEEPAEEGEEVPPEPEAPSGPKLTVKVVSCRGLPEETSTVVSYSYNTSAEEVEEEERVLLEGTTEEFEEPPEGTEHKYNFAGEHVLTKVTELLFYKLITQPLEFKIEGLEVPGKVQVSLVNLVWKPDPTPDDPDEEDYLPGAPGSFIRGWFPVVPETEDGEELSEEQKEKFPANAEVYLDISVNESLASEEDLKELNVLDFRVQSMHRLPALWGPKEDETWEDVPTGEDHPYIYRLKFKLPGEGGELVEFVSEPGELVPPEPEPEPEEGGGEEGGGEEQAEEGKEEGEEGGEEAEKKSTASGSEGSKHSRAKAPPANAQDEFAQLQFTESRVSLAEEAQHAKVSFGFRHSASLLPTGVAALKTLFSNRSNFEIELERALRSEEEYVYAAKYHAVVRLDGTGLLKAGETGAVLRCPLEPAPDYALPSEEDLEHTPPPSGDPEPDEGANPYLLAETYLLLDVQFRSALVPRPLPPPPVLPKVGDLLPTRAPVSTAKPELSAAKQFEEDIRSVVNELAEDYRQNFMEAEGAVLEAKEVEGRRQQMIFELNSSGRYYDFKDKLRRSVQRIVREKFHKEGVEAGSEEGKAFMSTLYVHLQESINATLNATFKPKHIKPSSVPAAPAQLAKVHAEELRLAVEAEINLNYGLASAHLNQRIILAPAEPVVWYDYGVLNMRCGDLAKAEECLRESLSLDPRHTPALLAYGVLLCSRDRYADAETYLQAATDYAPNDILAWSMLVLFYDLESRDLDRRAALKRVIGLEKAAAATGAPLPKRSPYLRAGHLAADLHGTQLVERAAGQEEAKRGGSEEVSLLLARAYLAAGQWAQCRTHLAAALAYDKRSAPAMTILGHSYFLELGWHCVKADQRSMAGCAKEVMVWYEKALAQRTPHVEMAQYLRLAKLYLFLDKNYEAKEILLKACQHQPSATTWLGLGVACYRQRELDQAEEALSEANILDTKNAEVWGMLSLVAIADTKLDEGELTLNRALKMGISTHETFPVDTFILEQIGSLLFEAGRYSLAAAALQRALSSARTPSLLTLLARTNIQDNDLPAAVSNYLSVVEDYSNEGPSNAVKRDALHQLIALSTKLKRNTDVGKFQSMLKRLPPEPPRSQPQPHAAASLRPPPSAITPSPSPGPSQPIMIPGPRAEARRRGWRWERRRVSGRHWHWRRAARATPAQAAIIIFQVIPATGIR